MLPDVGMVKVSKINVDLCCCMDRPSSLAAWTGCHSLCMDQPSSLAAWTPLLLVPEILLPSSIGIP